MNEDIGKGIRFDEANAVHRGMRQLAGTRVLAKVFAPLLHRLDAPVLRRTGGRQSLTAVLTGLPIVQLTTVGARSGQPRSMPIVGVPDGDRLMLVASNFGQSRNPGWYYNLKANPRCSVVVRGQHYQMDAYEAEGAERERLWALDLSVYPSRDRYAERATNRQIPVMVLQPVSAGD